MMFIHFFASIILLLFIFRLSRKRKKEKNEKTNKKYNAKCLTWFSATNTLINIQMYLIFFYFLTYKIIIQTCSICTRSYHIVYEFSIETNVTLSEFTWRTDAFFVQLKTFRFYFYFCFYFIVLSKNKWNIYIKKK